MGKKESDFQTKLIEKLQDKFPDSIILKNDETYCQGIPDLSIFYKKHWAMLEVKRNKNAVRRPNQDFYVSKANEMSFARFIYPENEEEVLNDLEQAFCKN